MKVVGDEISNLEGVDKRVEELQDKITRLARQLAGVKVWHQDHAETETNLTVSAINYSTFTLRQCVGGGYKIVQHHLMSSL